MKKSVLRTLIILFLFVRFSLNFLEAQVTVGAISAPDSSAVLELKSTTRGLLLPRVGLSRTDDSSPLLQHVAGMVVYNTNTTNDVTPGFYFDTGSKWVRMAVDGTPEPPRFFYMPSILLPTSTSDPAYNMINQTFTVDLYAQYKDQFSLSQSSTSTKNLTTPTPLPLYSPATALEYYITYYDNSVFTSVVVDDSGVLKYKLASSPVITEKTYMNIILEVK